MIRLWRAAAKTVDPGAVGDWWKEISRWRARNSLAYTPSADVIMRNMRSSGCTSSPRTATTYITTESGQHQMWAAQFFGFEEPNRWMTSGGLGTMGYGFPAAVGVRSRIRRASSSISRDASIQMCIQEMSCAVQYGLPVKIFILNNQYMGMVGSGSSSCTATAVAFLHRGDAGLRQARRGLLAASASVAKSRESSTMRSGR